MTPHISRPLLLGAVLVTWLWATVLPASALSLIRDAEAEYLLDTINEPLVIAAGLKPETVSVSIVMSDSLEAFPQGSRTIFLTSGLINQVESTDELAGILAHMLGHIRGGHMPQPPSPLKKYDLTNPPYSRTQEASADQIAIKILEKAGRTPGGWLTVLKNFDSQGRIGKERLAYLEEQTAQSPFKDATASPDEQARLALVQAKLYGFTQAPQVTLHRYPESDTSLAARYARAIAYYRMPETGRAIAEIDALIADEPQNAFFHEFKGQVLYEAGRAHYSIGPYRQANLLWPDAPLLEIGLAEALLAAGNEAQFDEAFALLQQAAKDERTAAYAYRLLAEAYADLGNEPMTLLAMAERYAAQGNRKEAATWAKHAMGKLPEGSAAWQRAKALAAGNAP